MYLFSKQKQKHTINLYLITFLKVTEWNQLYLKQSGIRCNYKRYTMGAQWTLDEQWAQRSGVQSPKLWTMNVWWTNGERTKSDRWMYGKQTEGKCKNGKKDCIRDRNHHLSLSCQFCIKWIHCIRERYQLCFRFFYFVSTFVDFLLTVCFIIVISKTMM